ncbi:MAG: PEP-CTERM sorting domain-containing protein [Phycisphaerae bacterium]|jgi:hypothetical protein|nr:PEP-CTERM sorting domain-containing protein [Phycisphaerae bacterium]
MKKTIHMMCVAAVVAALGVGTVLADVGYLGDGVIVSWGYDAYGQVSSTPAGSGFAAVAARGNQSLALKNDGSLVSWGDDHAGQVSDTPVGTGFAAVAAGAYHSLALKTDGSLVSWGRDNYNYGQVTDTPTGTGFAAVAAGHIHSIALKNDGSLVSWGLDNFGQVTDTPTGTGFAAVAGGSHHSLALKTDGSLVSWGGDGSGQVSDTPTGTGFAAVAAGHIHSIALKNDGSLVSWGDDSYRVVSDTPEGSWFAAVSIAAGNAYSLALKTDKSLVSWGYDEYNVLSDIPVAGYYLDIAGGGHHSVALKARLEYEDLVVTGTGAKALLKHDVSVSGDCTVETMLNGENDARIDIAGALVLEPGTDFSGSGEIDAETIELNGVQVSESLADAIGLDHGQISGHGAIATEFHGAPSSSITVSGGILTVGDLASYSGFSTAGELYVGGDTAVLLTRGIAGLGILTELDGGTLVAPNGVTLGTGDNLAGSGSVDAKVSAVFGSTIEATGPLALGNADAYDGFFSDGSLITGTATVTINDRNEAVLGSLTQLGDGATCGTLTAGNAVPADTHAHFLLEQGKNMVGRGSVNGNYKNHGHVIGDGIAPPQRIVFESGWTVTGKGTFEYVGFKGTFAPGDSPTITLTTHAWYADVIVQVELGGTTPGSGNDNHDQINDTATVWLDHAEPPTLEVLPWSNFVPEIGDEFVILTWQDSLDGSFGDVIVDPWFTTHGLDFDLHYNNIDDAGNLTIEATPEPATLSWLALGGLAMLRRRRRGMCG